MSGTGESADLLVLGGGPAGLAAAWRAVRTGRSVILLEALDHVGGMAASIEVAGIRVDAGSHRLHPATPAPLMTELRELLGGDLQTRPRNGRLRIGGEWVGFPLRPAELVRALPPRMLAGIARDALTGPVRRTREDTFAGVLHSGLGPTLYDALYAPYALKLWGLPGEQLDGEQARRRVTADTPWKVAGRLLAHARPRRLTGEACRGQGRIFHYPRRGFGQISDALAEAAAAQGAQIMLRRRVTGICLTSAPTVTCADGAEVSGRHIFSTLPLPALAGLLAEAPPAAVTDAAAQLRFRAMVLVYLVHGGGRWTTFDAHYLPGSRTPITRISEPANYRVSAEDPPGHTVVCAEIPCDEGDAMFTAAPGDLAAIVTDALARTGLPPLNLLDVVVHRLRSVYPIYARGYAEPLATLDTWALDLPHLTSFGRLGLFVHDNTHHALAMAQAAVSALGPGGIDPVAWSAARARFPHHCVAAGGGGGWGSGRGGGP
ncbi:MAG: FAD-dependent oxidoreductase [Sporichthyaceae bacterium]